LLIEQWRAGTDRGAAFQRIFEHYYRAVCGFFSKRGFSAHEAQELTQEAFIRVYKGLDGFRGESPFEAWLFQIAANIGRNAVRSSFTQKRAAVEVSFESENDVMPRLAVSLPDERATDPLGNVVEIERKRMLREAVNSLPDQMRRCVVLRVYQDLSYQEIATVMRLSVETVKAHLFQGRKQLKAKLAPYFEQIEY
jgi:RNA polymerase sigma-70 factor (ECF subfamily)